MISRLYLFLVILITVIQTMLPQWLEDIVVCSFHFFRIHGQRVLLVAAGSLCVLGLFFLPSFPAWGAA